MITSIDKTKIREGQFISGADDGCKLKWKSGGAETSFFVSRIRCLEAGDNIMETHAYAIVVDSGRYESSGKFSVSVKRLGLGLDGGLGIIDFDAKGRTMMMLLEGGAFKQGFVELAEIISREAALGTWTHMNGNVWEEYALKDLAVDLVNFRERLATPEQLGGSLPYEEKTVPRRSV